MKNPLLQRFIAIWKPDFFAKFIQEGKNNKKTTWMLWIVSSALVAFLIALFVFVGVAIKIPQFQQVIEQHVPDKAILEAQGDAFVTHNIQEPLISEFENKAGEKVLIIVDTKANTHSTEDLRGYDAGVLVARSAIYLKTSPQEDLSVFTAEKFSPSGNLSLSKELFLHVHKGHLFLLALSIFCGVFLVLALGRLFVALFWALILYILAVSFGVRESYFTYYQLVLNWYCAQLSIALVFFVLFQTTGGFIRESIVFMAFFLVNLSYWNKQRIALVSPTKKKEKIASKEQGEKSEKSKDGDNKEKSSKIETHK